MRPRDRMASCRPCVSRARSTALLVAAWRCWRDAGQPRRTARRRRPAPWRRRFKGSPPVARLAARPGQPAAGRRAAGVPGPDGGAARLSGGGQQVGLVVRPVPDRVPRLPAGRGQVRPAGGVHRHRRQGWQRLGGRLPAPVPGELSELHRSQRVDRARVPGLDLLPADAVLPPPAATPPTCTTTPAPT